MPRNGQKELWFMLYRATGLLKMKIDVETDMMSKICQ